MEPSNVVDHIVPHRGDQELFWDVANNWQALCRQCHSSIKQAWEKSGVEPGVSAEGIPLDPTHHWRTEGGKRDE